jgi:hypothetical protein
LLSRKEGKSHSLEMMQAYLVRPPPIALQAHVRIMQRQP